MLVKRDEFLHESLLAPKCLRAWEVNEAVGKAGGDIGAVCLCVISPAPQFALAAVGPLLPLNNLKHCQQGRTRTRRLGNSIGKVEKSLDILEDGELKFINNFNSLIFLKPHKRALLLKMCQTNVFFFRLHNQIGYKMSKLCFHN